LLLGEMADALLLSGQRAVPEKAKRFGYRFTFDRLEDALQSIFTRPRGIV
jgi:NAD dependent epimerase/dehydratase family enzyme